MIDIAKIMRSRPQTSLGRVALAHRLNCSVMKSGQGATICRAGTSQVPAVLKRTSRVIKNSL